MFQLVRYDNLKSAVARVLKGRRRSESDRFVALRSHYLFESSFCQRGEQGAHEKGGVESEVGRFRRRHLVPVPRVGSMAELNRLSSALDKMMSSMEGDLRDYRRERFSEVRSSLSSLAAKTSASSVTRQKSA